MEKPAAGAAGHGTEVGKARSSWVEDMEKMLRDPSVVESERWNKQSIYRVPQWIKDMNNSKAYEPSMVSLGPLHHGTTDHLQPMEEHKRRALWYLVQRSGKPLEEFVAAVEEVAEELRDAYEERFEGNNFVGLMITDGCFLLELFRMYNLFAEEEEDDDGGKVVDYDPKDPIFSKHGAVYMWRPIKYDMLRIENQLPLLLLQKLQAVVNGTSPDHKEINKMVLDFLGVRAKVDINRLGLHPLDIFHRNLTNVARDGAPHHALRCEARDLEIQDIPRSVTPSAAKLYEWGIHFKRAADSFLNVHFEGGVLSMSAIWVHDHTETEFLNQMAFERLHVGAGSYVTAYAVFMDDIINTTRDVELLTRKGVIKNFLGSEEEVAKLFNTLCKGAVVNESRVLRKVNRGVRKHCRKPWNRWRAKFIQAYFSFIQTYFSSPWVFISLVAATILLVATLLQTVYTIIKQ